MASRGKGRRRREALALRSSRDLLKRGKSGMSKQLPPPPKEKDGEQLLPRSLKRIMALRQSQGAAQSAATTGMTGKKRGNKFKMTPPAASGTSSTSAAATGTVPAEPLSRADASGAQPSGAEPTQQSLPARGSSAAAGISKAGGDRQSGQQQNGVAAAGSSKVDHLTERQRARREHQKARQATKKAKRKGQSGLVGASDDEDALERKVYLDRNKPKFGEQAMAPLQTSLKRKHWDGGANARHSALFEQQMRLAAARAQPDEAVRDQVIEAYRQQKRSAANGRKGDAAPAATRASLAALTSKHASAMKH